MQINRKQILRKVHAYTVSPEHYSSSPPTLSESPTVPAPRSRYAARGAGGCAEGRCRAARGWPRPAEPRSCPCRRAAPENSSDTRRTRRSENLDEGGTAVIRESHDSFPHELHTPFTEASGELVTLLKHTGACSWSQQGQQSQAGLAANSEDAGLLAQVRLCVLFKAD